MKKKLYFGSNLKMYKTTQETVLYLRRLTELTRDISREQMERFLFELTYGLIRGVVEEQAKDAEISEEEKAFIADFYKYSFVGLMLDWIRRGMSEDYVSLVQNISLTVRGGIGNAIGNFAGARR